MPTSIVVGSGPAAAGAVMALAENPENRIVVLDLGSVLEEPLDKAREAMAASLPAGWDGATRALVSAQPLASGHLLPEKRSFGSDFPFRDVGQLAGLHSDPRVNASTVSAAYGGFSNVWGAQVMPFSRETFHSWPVSYDEMIPHYEAVLREVPFAAEEDDLADLFPLIAPSKGLPALTPRSEDVLRRYAMHRDRLRRWGVTLGRARLAFDGRSCVRCGLCMTGCPYSYVYSARHTLDRFRRSRRIEYHKGLLVTRVTESGETVQVRAQDIASRRFHEFEADRVFIGCGGIGSTRLMATSLGMTGARGSLKESVQFVLPFVSRRSTGDPRDRPAFTLNQFNMLVAPPGDGLDVSQLHFYDFNPAFVTGLPGPLRARSGSPALAPILSRLSVALGYLPSWRSPELSFTMGEATESGMLAMRLSATRSSWLRNATLRRVLVDVARSAPFLDLWPVLPRLAVAEAAKSYHFGGSFPHVRRPSGAFESDDLGRVAGWRRVHLIDASVFPSVAATTFTLTILANAHRIASRAASATDLR